MKKKQKRPICGCTHDLAFHEPDGDGGGTVCHSRYYHSYNEMWIECMCRQYTGPRILDPGYVAREMRVDP